MTAGGQPLALRRQPVLGVRRAARDELPLDDPGGLELLEASESVVGEIPGSDWRNSLKRAAPLEQA